MSSSLCTLHSSTRIGSSRPSKLTNRYLKCRASNQSDVERQQRLPVPLYPPNSGAPPPPPPPPPPAMQGLLKNRRNLLLSAVVAAGAALGVVAFKNGDNSSLEEEMQLAYVASMLEVPGFSDAIRPIFDPQDGTLVCIGVQGPSGTKYMAIADDKPGLMLLRVMVPNDRLDEIYTLQTNLKKIDIGDSKQMLTIFKTPGWEDALLRIQ